MKKLVIAGNKFEAVTWIHADLDKIYATKPSTKSMSDYIIVSNPDQLRGMRDPKGIFIGTWKQREDILEILSTLLVNMTEPSKHKIIQNLLVEHIIQETQ